MSSPLFSVIIPTHDRLELLKRAVQSVREQSFSDYEIVIVDDGSKDGTSEWLAASESWLRGIRQSNSGPGAARNTGVRAARGCYLAFLDSDDLWFPWTLKLFASVIEEHSPSIIAGHWIEFIDEAELETVEEGKISTQLFGDVLESSRKSLMIGSGTCVLRREVFHAAKFLEDRFNAEDHDLILQLGTQPKFIEVISPPTVAWRRHSTSETSNLSRTFSGVTRLVDRERACAYPGGKGRAKQRREILTRHTRPVALECLRSGSHGDAWRLYVSTFAWNFSLGRSKFLLGFLLVALSEYFRRRLFR